MPREAPASSAWTVSLLRVEPTPLLYAFENTGRILLISITYTQISYYTLSSSTVESVLACIWTQAPSQSCLTGCLSWDRNSKGRLGIGVRDYENTRSFPSPFKALCSEI